VRHALHIKFARILVVSIVPIWSSACVTSGTHDEVLAQLAQTQEKLKQTEDQLKTTTDEKEACNASNTECSGKLDGALEQNNQLVTKVSSMGQNVEALLGEKDKFAEERDQMKNELEEARRMRAAAEARNAEFKQLLSKLHKMIDAGTLKVKVRNGLMVVSMSSDVLFPPGGTKLKPEARAAIEELAVTIAGFPSRKFQVVGHSDPTPIRTARFPSNWELSSQRAIEVVRMMVEAGVPPEMLSAAGSAEFDPLVTNDTTSNMTLNRRVEVVFVPKIDEMPGFEQILAESQAGGG